MGLSEYLRDKCVLVEVLDVEDLSAKSVILLSCLIDI